MTKRDTGGEKAAQLPGSADKTTVQQQLALEEQAEQKEGSTAQPLIVDGGEGTDGYAHHQRLFVPSNRERILRQLSSLTLSPDFPADAGIVTDPGGMAAIFTDGLRGDEIAILGGGRLQRFPVLAELRSSACRNRARVIGIGDVISLCFRNQEEADDFRFRPVDELDTAYLPCVAEPALFGLEGAARFSSEHSVMPEARKRAATADRIAAAICCVLELGAAEPSCWLPVSGLLCQGHGAPGLDGIGVRTALKAGGATPAVEESATILRVFMEHDRAPSGQLVEMLGRSLMRTDGDTKSTYAVRRWLDMATAVLANRMVLDGEILSDKGSVPLRAALLAAVVDDVKDLPPFLNAERPAGRKVLAAAAFLIGLRTGIADMSWQRKSGHLSLLSPLLVALNDAAQAVRDEALSAFQTEPDETAAGTEFVLCWRDRELARWTISGSSPDAGSPSSAPPPSGAGSDSMPYGDTAAEHADGSGNLSIEGPGGRIVEVIRPDEVTTLRMPLVETDRLRKPKDILEAACKPGICWRAGVSADGTAALYADFPGMPDDAVLQEAVRRLSDVLPLYLATKKVAAKRAKIPTDKPSRKKTPPETGA